HAAVPFTVQVKGGRPGPNRERRLQASLKVVAVIPQRRTATGAPGERLEHVGEILARLVAWRPVPPMLRDYVVKPPLGTWQLVVQEVPAHPCLAHSNPEGPEGHERLENYRRRRQGDRDVAREPPWLPRGYSPDRGSAPVVANHNSALVTPKRDAKRQHVGYLVGDQVAVIRCQVGRRIAAGKRGHCPPAALGQVRPEVAPGPRAVRIAVNEKRQWRARVTPRERDEPKPPRGTRKMPRRAHPPNIYCPG